MAFSIIIPLYNKQLSIAKTLESILAQSYRGFEVIVVDDGSTDNSKEVAMQYTSDKLKIIQQSNSGVSTARNTGITHAKYDQLVFVDADDLISKNYLQHINHLISLFPQAGAYSTRYQTLNNSVYSTCKIATVSNVPKLIEDYFYVASRGNLPIVASGVCIPKKVLDDVGYFPIGQTQGEDQDLWSRIGLNYPVAVHPSVDITYVLDAENRISANSIPNEELDYSKNIQQLIDNNLVKKSQLHSVKRYISGHLLHLVQLNLRAGNLELAEKLLSDPRTHLLALRRLKWRMLLVKEKIYSRYFKRKEKIATACAKPTIQNLLNDKKMGGILSVVESLKNSNLANNFEFDFSVVSPSSWKRRNCHSDIVMVHYASSWSTLFPNFITKWINPSSKLILQEHHYTKTFEQTVPSIKRFHWMLKLNYSLFDQVIAVSHGQANWILDNKLIKASKLTVIPQCRELSAFLKVKQLSSIGKIKLAAYGRLSPEKGFQNLIKAFNEVNHPNLILKIAGSGPSEDLLREKAGNNKNIEFVGKVDDVPHFLSNCDLVVIPSVSEAFGLVCLEAKAAGKPVIASDIDGLREQVISPINSASNTCGMLLKDITSKGIANALVQIPKLPLLDWGKNGRIQVENAWCSYQENWHKLLTRLITS